MICEEREITSHLLWNVSRDLVGADGSRDGFFLEAEVGAYQDQRSRHADLRTGVV